jgi:tetratricopeptide (TPR) repeat protein
MEKQGSEANQGDTGAVPQTALTFFESGWTNYSNKEYPRSEADFLKAIELSPDYIDAFYGLGMVYQASGRKQEAIAAFEKVIALLENAATGDTNRTRMLARFAKGHINRINTGDWQMEH